MRCCVLYSRCRFLFHVHGREQGRGVFQGQAGVCPVCRARLVAGRVDTMRVCVLRSHSCALSIPSFLRSSVRVQSANLESDGKAHYWTSTGDGVYNIGEAEGVGRGTKVIRTSPPACVCLSPPCAASAPAPELGLRFLIDLITLVCFAVHLKPQSKEFSVRHVVDRKPRLFSAPLG